MEDNDKYFEPLLSDLLKLDFHLTPKIKEIENKILLGTSNFPNNLTGLTAYLLCQIMLGEKDKACSIVRRIWDIGGDIKPKDEALYTDCLINLGLDNMAEILLKPRYENVEENSEMFGDVMQKFALQQGNSSRLFKMLALNGKNNNNAELREILYTYRKLDREEDFTNVMKIIFEHSCKQALAYEHVFYSDRGFAEVEVIIYTNHDVENGHKFENLINQKIDAYFASVNRKRLNNIFVSVLMTSEHYSIEAPLKKEKLQKQEQSSDYNPADWGF